MHPLIRDLIPPLIMRRLVAWKSRNNGFSGDYQTWGEAAAGCRGYENPDVHYHGFDPASVAGSPDVDMRTQQLMAAFAVCQPRTVLDVGGGDGAYYYRTDRFMPVIRWEVLETPAMVKEHSPGSPLTFHDSLDTIGMYDLILMGGFMQCVSDPWHYFDTLSARAPYVILNRLPLIDRDRIVIQRVSTPYVASYPERFFGRDSFMERITRTHRVLMRWETEDRPLLDGKEVPFSGMLLTADRQNPE